MIKLIADSTCDLPEEILGKYNIDVAPLTIKIGNTVYKDRIDISTDDFFKKLGALKEPPTTSMPSPTEFVKLFEKAVADGYDEILVITMSSGTSGSYQSACIAMEYFKEQYNNKIYVVDSKSMSHGSGYLILKTAMLREKGMNFEQLIDFNESYKKNMKHLLSVSDLTNLIRSGRLNNVSAMIGKMLRINPVMSMKDGKGAIVAKIRGQNRVYNHYIAEMNKRIDILLTDFIIIGYSSDKSKAEFLKAKIEEETNFNGDIYIMQMGVSVSTHVGFGGVALYFVEKGNTRDGLIYNEIETLKQKKLNFEAWVKEHMHKNK